MNDNPNPEQPFEKDHHKIIKSVIQRMDGKFCNKNIYIFYKNL